jgi:hypothetical protein
MDEKATGERIEPADAGRALAEVRRRQQQVVELSRIPRWYWWAVAALMVVLAVGADEEARHRGLFIGCLIAFLVGLAVATARVVVPTVRAPVRNAILGPEGVLWILGLVAAVIALTLAVTFTLRALGFDYPATAGCLAGGLLLGVGGPALMRRLSTLMQANLVGGTPAGGAR